MTTLQRIDAVPCPCCGSALTMCKGPIFDATVFAGRRLVDPIPGGSLYDCTSCRLAFRWPTLAQRDYDRLYAQGATQSWDVSGTRVDHRLTIEAILECSPEGGNILDVGCGAGTLLCQLPARYGRFGIEISDDARQLAAQRHISLVGRSFDDLAQEQRKFDVVIATDVIEHHPHPQRFLADCLGCVSPGGHLILSTGDRTAPLWRLCGNRFWYCQYAEHLTYLSPGWIRSIAADRYDISSIKRFAYAKLSVISALKQVLGLVIYMSSSKTYRLLAGRRVAHKNGPPASVPAPGAGLTRDHFLAVLRKR